MTSCYHQFPWPSLATHFYHPSLPEGLPGYILYQYRAVVDRFEQVTQPLLEHVKWSTWVHRLWLHPHCWRSVLHVLFVYFGWFSRWVVGGRTAAIFGILPPGFIQYRLQHSCAIAINLFLHTLRQHPYSSTDMT